MQNSSGDGNGQDSHHNQQHYSLNFPSTPISEPFYTNISSASVSSIPGLLRLAPTSPMGMPSVSMSSSGIQAVSGATHGYTIPGSNPLKRTAHDAGFSDQRQCEVPSSDDDTLLSEKFSIPQTSVSPPESQAKTSEQSPTTKKTKGRVKIKMEFIDNKLRRYTTFSKRKTGIMKKAYELSTLTGTQVMLLVASETGHVYTFATRKLQPMITSEAGKALIQTCLNSPDPSASQAASGDQRMSATGFEETELCYNINEDEQKEYDEDDDGVEEDDEDERPATLLGKEGSNGLARRAGGGPPSTSTNLTPPGRNSGASSVLVSAASVAPPAATVGTTSAVQQQQQLLTSQLLSQIKQSQHLAFHLAASQATTAGAPPEGSRITSTPMSSLFQTTSGGLLQLPEGLVLVNNPASVIQAVKTEHAGAPPNTAQPTDLSKSRVIS